MIDMDHPVVEFNALDRCDASALGLNGVKGSCGAQAVTLAQRDDMPTELLFCLHHRKKFVEALRQDEWDIIDDDEAISRLAPTVPEPISV